MWFNRLSKFLSKSNFAKSNRWHNFNFRKCQRVKSTWTLNWIFHVRKEFVSSWILFGFLMQGCKQAKKKSWRSIWRNFWAFFRGIEALALAGWLNNVIMFGLRTSSHPSFHCQCWLRSLCQLESHRFFGSLQAPLEIQISFLFLLKWRLLMIRVFCLVTGHWKWASALKEYHPFFLKTDWPLFLAAHAILYTPYIV